MDPPEGRAGPGSPGRNGGGSMMKMKSRSRRGRKDPAEPRRRRARRRRTTTRPPRAMPRRLDDSPTSLHGAPPRKLPPFELYPKRKRRRGDRLPAPSSIGRPLPDFRVSRLLPVDSGAVFTPEHPHRRLIGRSWEIMRTHRSESGIAPVSTGSRISTASA